MFYIGRLQTPVILDELITHGKVIMCNDNLVANLQLGHSIEIITGDFAFFKLIESDCTVA